MVNGFTKMTDSFVEEFLTKDGETVEEAKERMRNEEQQREEARAAEAKKREARQKQIIGASRKAAGEAGVYREK